MAQRNNNKYIITRSNYTVKSKHKGLNDSVIYERDYMINNNRGDWGGDHFTGYNGANNFKILRDGERGFYRKRKYGKWLTPPQCDGSTAETAYWTAENLDCVTLDETENRIVLKPNHNSILDFAYFGNCTELVRVSLENIINKFPAELYVSDSNVDYVIDGHSRDDFDAYRTLGGDKVYVENPFKVDIFSKKIKKGDNVNVNRFFCESQIYYEILNTTGGTVGYVDMWNPTYLGDPCANGTLVAETLLTTADTNFKIYEYYVDGEYLYMADSQYAGYRIRPISSVIERFYEGLDDFEGTLLNRESNPLYTAIFDTPVQTDDGVFTTRKSYTWPTDNGWNLDIESEYYDRYVKSLLAITNFYDEYYTDNLWRSLTHESIKNMDLTFMGRNNDEDKLDYSEGTGRLRGLMYSFGRQFDEIKKYIDNIKNTNNITYNGNNNLPDYFLSDSLEMAGWDVSSPSNAMDMTASVSGLYSSDSNSKKYTSSDASTLFLRELKINSRNILSKKGTKNGIEDLLGLFGFVSYDYGRATYINDKNSAHTLSSWNALSERAKQQYYDYSIYEYVASVKPKDVDTYIVSENALLPVEEWNAFKRNIDKNGDTFERYSIDGLPVRIMSVSSNGVTQKYMIPWFERGISYDGNLYFQMFGGWNKLYSKTINEEIAPNKTSISSTDDFTIYDETIKYLHVVNKVSDLKELKHDDIKEGNIYYVYDISDFQECFGETITNEVSNYFTLVDADYCRIYGTKTVDSASHTGWKNISVSNIANGFGDGLKVLYLESIIDVDEGNNPHVGYGNYDGGSAYWEYLRKVFKYSIDTDNFEDAAYDCETGLLNSAIGAVGFLVNSEVKDNIKCWYFADETDEDRLKVLNRDIVEEDYSAYATIGVSKEKMDHGYTSTSGNTIPSVGRDFTSNGQSLTMSNMVPFNYETGIEEGGEAASYSVMNSKKLVIEFSPANVLNGFSAYLYESVLPYLKQMVPSTSLLEVKISDAGYSVISDEFDNNNIEAGVTVEGDTVIVADEDAIILNEDINNNNII